MPGIADPGERLVAAVAAAGLPVEVVPGPSAAITALVASGLPAGRWVFEGFLPRKGAARSERLAELATERRTIVVYESPHRAARTLADLASVLGPDRRVAVGRELTKLHEEVRRSTLAEAVAWAEAKEPVGELVLVVDGAPAPAPAGDDDVEAAVAAALAVGPLGEGRRRQGGLGPRRPQAPGLRGGRHRQPCHRASVVCMVCAWQG